MKESYKVMLRKLNVAHEELKEILNTCIRCGTEGVYYEKSGNKTPYCRECYKKIKTNI